MEKELTLKTERFVQVKDGQKTATLRNGKVNCRLGSNVVIDSETKNTISVEVTSVSVCKMKDLTPEMLKKNNYKSYADAKKVMSSLYPDFTDDSVITCVEFKRV